jgi:hypothetical protein
MKLHYPEGMKLHGDNACKYLGFERYDFTKDRDEPAMFWLYTDEDYKTLANHKGKRYVVWHNQDVLLLSGKYSNQLYIVRGSSITHVCLNHCMEPELFQLGIYAIQRYIFWGDLTKYKPSEKLTKDCYMCANAGRGVEYGEFIFNSLAWKYPDWTFHIFGIEPTLRAYCDNVRYYGWIPEDDMDERTKNFGLCLRYNFHDGFPQILCKALLRGQFTLTRLDYDGLTLQFRDMKELFDRFDEISFKIENGETANKIIPDKMINNFDFIR